MDESRVTARADGVRQAIERASVTVSSPGHLVTVAVAAGNALTGVRIAPSLARRRGHEVAEMVLATFQEAYRQLRERLASEVAEALPSTADTPDPAEIAASLADVPDLPPVPDAPDLAQVPEPELPAEWSGRPGAHELAAATERWQAFEATVERLAVPYRDAATGCAAAEDTVVTTPGGEIEVRVRAGKVTDLAIADEALHAGAGPFAEQLFATIQQAQAAAAIAEADRAQSWIGPALDVRGIVQTHQPQLHRSGHDRQDQQERR